MQFAARPGHPDGYARVGSHYQPFRAKFQRLHGQAWTPGAAVFQYDNDQPASTLWYHDHTLGMTRVNVYAVLPVSTCSAAVSSISNPSAQDRHRRLATPRHTLLRDPLAIQDRTFTTDVFFYPSRAYFDEFRGPYVPDSDVSPIWNPEFFGNTMLVNGKTCQRSTSSRVGIASASSMAAMAASCSSSSLPVTRGPTGIGRPALPQIGAEGGFLPAPVELDRFVIGPAERADVVVDFGGLAEGTMIYLINEGPDEPFRGRRAARGLRHRGSSDDRPGHAVPHRSAQATDTTETPRSCPRRRSRVGDAHPPGVAQRQPTHPGFDGPIAALLGTVNPDGTGHPLGWADPITEKVAVGATEVWEIHNFTADAHPIHIRGAVPGGRSPKLWGSARGPETSESGLKDTVITYPGEITRVKAHFDRAGLYGIATSSSTRQRDDAAIHDRVTASAGQHALQPRPPFS